MVDSLHGILKVTTYKGDESYTGTSYMMKNTLISSLNGPIDVLASIISNMILYRATR